MKWLGITLLIGLVSCCPQKLLNSSTTDSVRIEVIEKVVKDTITVTLEIPREVEKIITRDTVSTLETKYALSKALIDYNGYLHHSLEQKSINQEKNVQIEYVTRDSIVWKERIVDNVVQVERKESWWQKTQRTAAWIFLSIILVFLGFKISKFLI